MESCVCVRAQLLNSLLAEEKLGIDGVGALFPVSQVHKCTHTHTVVSQQRRSQKFVLGV